MILVADWHIRRDKPRCRKDDFFSTQERKFEFILKKGAESPPLIVAGDFFDVPRVPDFLLQWAITKIKKYISPDDIIIVPGQHDLYYHSISNFHESSLSVMAAAKVATIVNGLSIIQFPTWTPAYKIYTAPFGVLPVSPKDPDEFNILVWHQMVIKKQEELWQGQTADVAGKILRKYPGYDIIVTGDNHKTFMEISKGRYLINPGSVMRQTIDQVDHKPCIFKVEIIDDKPKVEKIFIPIEEDVFDHSCNLTTDKDEKYLNELSEKIQTQYSPGVSFEDRLKSLFKQDNTSDEVQEIIWEAYGQ